jgi:hypothetical protein
VVKRVVSVVGRGRGTAVGDESSVAVKRTVGRARPPPKPPGSSPSDAPGGAAVSLTLEERRANRASANANHPAPTPAAASFSSATVPTPKKSSTSPDCSLSSSSSAPMVSLSGPLPLAKAQVTSRASTVSTNAKSISNRGSSFSEETNLKQSGKVALGNDDVLLSRTADDSTRQFLLEVVRSHEEGIRDEDTGSGSASAASTMPTASEVKKKPRAPTVRLKGTWSKASGPKKEIGDVMSWSSLGLDILSEHEGGTPQVVFQCSQLEFFSFRFCSLFLMLSRYFLEKRCYNYPGLFKTLGTPAKVNLLMESFADGSFQSFDGVEVTPLDVLQSLKTFLLIVPEPPIPCSLFFDLLDACYEVSKEKQVNEVRNLLMRVSSACRVVARTVIDLCRKVLASQPSLQLNDIALFIASALARPAGGNPAEVESQSYAISLALLELGEAAFDPKAVVERPVLAPVVSDSQAAEMEALNEEVKKANEKVASLTRQLDEARKGQVVLKKKLDIVVKENGELKRKLAESQKIIDSWKANAVMDMY